MSPLLRLERWHLAPAPAERLAARRPLDHDLIARCRIPR